MTKKVMIMNIKERLAAEKIYYAAGGKKTIYRPGWAKNAKTIKNTTTRSKKCMSYNTTSAPKMRSMNYDSTYNCPTAYNGVKMMMNNY